MKAEIQHIITALCILVCFMSVSDTVKVFAQSQTNVRPSVAQQPANVLLNNCSAIIAQTNVPQQLVPFNNSRHYLGFQVQQVGNTIPTIMFSFTSVRPSAGTTETVTLQPSATWVFEGITVPQNAVWIAGPAGAVVTCFTA